MAIIGFTKFKDKILDGTKKQTIRKLRKNPIKVGDDLHLYWRLRTKSREKLFSTKCVETYYIVFRRSMDWSGKECYTIDRYKKPDAFGFMTLLPSDVEELAKRDGFKDSKEFFDFFTALYHPGEYDVFQVIVWDYPLSQGMAKTMGEKTG